MKHLKHIALLLFLGIMLSAPLNARAEFTLPSLPYSTKALEPQIDQRTMEIHHDRHHAAYVNNLNAQIKAYPELNDISVEDLQGKISMFNQAVRNNGGGHYNHSQFWQVMAQNGRGGTPSLELIGAINNSFGSLDEMKDQFNKAATSVFGSGWAWLIVGADGKLAITTTPNQDNPLMDLPEIQKGIPLIGLDVWEHAYYLKYQNMRPQYITSWWDLVNWNEVNSRYSSRT